MGAAELVAATKTTTALVKFIKGQGLMNAMSSIVGDIHIDAAKFALTQSTISRRPQHGIESAINHLQTAHIAYKKVHDKYWTFKGRNVDWAPLHQAMANDIWVCCLMALCYTFNRDYAPARTSLSLAEEVYSRIDYLYEDKGSSTFNRGGLIIVISAKARIQ